MGNKTIETEACVEDYLSAIVPEQKQEDCRAICAIMERLTGSPPKMWGGSIVGFGQYHYKYESGREGDDVDENVLEEMIAKGLKLLAQKYPE